MTSSLLLVYGTFMLISLSGALAPGPLTAMAVTEGARSGRWAGTWLAAGHGLVEIPLVFAIAFGLGAWLRLPLVAGIVGVVGAVVLIWMGYGLAVGAWRGSLSLSSPNAMASSSTPTLLRWGHLPGGVLFTLANPYWCIWWATLGATYISRVMSMGVGLLTVAGLALTHWSTDLVWLGGLSIVAASGRGLIGEKGYRAALLACGVFLLAFGLYFAWTGIRFLTTL